MSKIMSTNEKAQNAMDHMVDITLAKMYSEGYAFIDEIMTNLSVYDIAVLVGVDEAEVNEDCYEVVKRYVMGYIVTGVAERVTTDNYCLL